ncbi:MAG: carbamoyltransferase HypF [Oscillospiraceae bacterium]|nr:carbamoyltransferase HypF [Oscillospiraceae bacterium]
MEIRGVVQGVGFRPFVHRLVSEHDLNGYIKNTSSGVELELEGEHAALERFCEALPQRAPKLAVIEEIRTRYTEETVGYRGFTIRQSKTEAFRNTLISPDICICDDCLRELLDPADRRYRYPFINCTNCGPRFTIVKDVPYDRALTSMGKFPMCPRCDREYHDIENRRYHAQPDCCPDCGPRVFFLDGAGRELPGDAIETARAWLKAGKIVAVKGLGGMHLACRCDDAQIAARLRQRKQRDEKPFAVMCRSLETARRVCTVSDAEAEVLCGFRRPIVLLQKRAPGLSHLSENGYLGVMLPYTPLHVLLFGADIDMLIMTSANLSDTPILCRNEDALRELRGIADGFLLHDRDIQTRCDDSLCWVLDGREYPARRSRGYVPFPVRVENGRSGILACGAEQKASFCLTKGNYVFPSQHIGDLKNVETLEHYEGQFAHFQRLFDIEPELLVCDLHPDYMSTRYAQDRAEAEGLPLLQVQHHHAHMAACMADNDLPGPCIGLIWDGTGYGTDGTTWGGECLVGGYESFERRGSIRPIPLIGGDRAVKELDRVAFTLLRDAGCETGGIPNADTYETMLRAGLNCPLSSGMGRLFDGVAAILGIKRLANYEGQGAVLLEAAAAEDEGEYPAVLTGEPLCFDWRPMIRAIVSERDGGVPAGVIAARFLNTLIRMAAETAASVSRETGVTDVVLSGGSFQNMYIMHRLPEKLRERGLKPWHHSRVSTNDEGLSLGQAMIAAAIWKKDEENVSCSSFETD